MDHQIQNGRENRKRIEIALEYLVSGIVEKVVKPEGDLICFVARIFNGSFEICGNVDFPVSMTKIQMSTGTCGSGKCEGKGT